MALSSAGTKEEEMFWMKADVALAVTLIKTKLPGMSGAQFASALAAKIRSGDEKWRKRAQGLQQEVEKLKVDLMILRSTESTRPQAPGSDDTENFCQDLQGPPESGSQRSDPPGEDVDIPGSTDVCLPGSSNVPPLLFSYDTRLRGQSLPVKVHFLQSLCGSVQTDEVSVDLWLRGPGSLLVKMDLVLDSVVSLCQDPLLVSNSSLVLRSCKFVARSMDRCWYLGLGSAEVKKCVEGWMRGVTTLLLHGDWKGDQAGDQEGNQDGNWTQSQTGIQTRNQTKNHTRNQGKTKNLTGNRTENRNGSQTSNQTRNRNGIQTRGVQHNDLLSQCLMALGGSDVSRPFLIGHILGEVSAVSEQLWNAMQENSDLETFPVVEYENSCYLLRVLEELLLKLEDPLKVELEAQMSNVLVPLKRRLLLLSEEFGLFSVYVWKVMNLLTPEPTPEGTRTGQDHRGTQMFHHTVSRV